MKVLLLEDNPEAAKKIIKLLAKHRISCDECNLVGDAEVMVNHRNYDLLIVDLKLPDSTGHNFIQYVRGLKSKSKNTVPIMVLSNIRDTEEKLTSFHYGADEYTVKPDLNDREFVARAFAVIRRNNGFVSDEIQIGELKINLSSEDLFVNDNLVNLSVKEFSIVRMLMLKKNIAIPKERILNTLYSDQQPYSKVLDVFMCNIRKKIGQFTDVNYINTRWGGGYIIQDKYKDNKIITLAKSA